MNSVKFFSLILAGGQGTRLWPQSTTKKPKQYLQLQGDESLIESSISRLKNLSEKDETYIVSVQEQKKLIEQIDDKMFSSNNMILEPSGKNTAPCLFLALLRLLKDGASEDDFVGVFPSDHVISSNGDFQETIKNILSFDDSNNYLFTIGIKPTSPHTGYGYIERDESLNQHIFKVKQFKEKPTADVAEEYLSKGTFSWNAGIFVATVGSLLNAFKEHAPEIWQLKEELSSCSSEEEVAKVYDKMPNISIDYCLMEKANNVATTQALFDWNDLGSWDAFDTVLDEKNGNHHNVEFDYFEESSGNIVYAPGKAVTLIGVKDMIVVHTDNALMVIPKDQSQKVKEVREMLKKSKAAKKFL